MITDNSKSVVPSSKNKKIEGEGKFLTGKIDRVFKTIFVQDNDFHLMEALLSECLESNVKIIKYLYPELDVASISDKEKKVDVLIELEGKKVLVELNTEGLGIRLRNFNYFTNFYSTRIKRGSDYYDDTEHILIDLSYKIGNDQPIKNTFFVQNEVGEHYVDNFKIIEFNMDKITKECYDKIVKGMEEQYKYLCMLNLDKNKLSSLSEYDNIVKEYMDKLVDLNNNDEFRYVVTAEEDAKLTQKLLQDYARDQGERNKSLEIAKNLIELNLDINSIVQATGLSKEEIEELKDIDE